MTMDPIARGLDSGWSVQDASLLDKNIDLEADVVIIGTGAGGGITAEILSNAGYEVVMVEEGPLKSSSHFHMKESEAYPQLYQDASARTTRDKAITILQGRCVGGSTTVNWTSSFDTPDQTLNHWQKVHGIEGHRPEEMAPWFNQVRKRLNINPWPIEPNPNNAALIRGTQAMGWSHGIMDRNVSGCLNLGYCGMGCPVNAKQSMLVTTIPAALERGARLFTRTRAWTLSHKNNRVDGLVCRAMDGNGVKPTGILIHIRAKRYILAGGSIGSPALLLRSKAPDPAELIGRRTFLHPVNLCLAVMPEKTEPFSGAPQSVYSDQFLWPEDDQMGFKIEAPPIHPLLTSTIIGWHGPAHRALIEKLPYLQGILTLGRDGFNPQSQGGRAVIDGDGNPGLDYPLNDYLFNLMRRAYACMVELQFAAGAVEVYPIHAHITQPLKSWKDAKKSVQNLEMAPLLTKIFSAHVMGGCPMGGDPKHSVVDQNLQHHQLENLSIFDGSVFPTSIGANPQVSIYALVSKNATKLAENI